MTFPFDERHVQPHTADRNADGTPSLNQLYCSLLCLPTAPVSSIGNSGPFGSWPLYDKTRALQDDPRPSNSLQAAPYPASTQGHSVRQD